MVRFLVPIFLFLSAPAWSGQWETIESDCIYQMFEGTANDTSDDNGAFSTHSISGTLLSWSIESLGTGVGTFDLGHSTAVLVISGDLPVPGAASPILVSSVTTVNAGRTLSEDVRGFLKNPRLRVRTLAASTTLYIRMTYCQRPQVR